jgi:hypothetical protein
MNAKAVSFISGGIIALASVFYIVANAVPAWYEIISVTKFNQLYI